MTADPIRPPTGEDDPTPAEQVAALTRSQREERVCHLSRE